jgi:HAD superfamily hydrolase (TIGR01549 family)
VYDAVIFDNDGVLVTVCEFSVFLDATRRAFEGLGVDPAPADVEAVAGVSDPGRVREVCDRHGLDPEAFWRRRDREATLAQREETRAGRRRPYDDLDVVRSLPARTAIVSSNQHETIEFLLDHLDLRDAFDAYFGREHSMAGVDRKKPDPHYVRRAMAAIDADPERTLMVGDSESDVRAARNAGIDSAFLRRGHRVDHDLSVAPTHELSTLYGLRGLVGTSAD